MGSGKSGVKSKGGGGGGKSAGTPSGVSYDQFMKMPIRQRYDTIGDILNNPNIKTPPEMDDSGTSKVIYALGIKNKPQVVSDKALDSMPGEELFRTVYEGPGMPPPTPQAILDQIAHGDYTYLSGVGGSVHGRALYFATNFTASATYGRGKRNPYAGRAKINPGANIVKESDLERQMKADGFNNTHQSVTVGKATVSYADMKALYSLAHGIDGWSSDTSFAPYKMIINRGQLTMSDTFKDIYGTYKSGAKKGQKKTRISKTWKSAG